MISKSIGEVNYLGTVMAAPGTCSRSLTIGRCDEQRRRPRGALRQYDVCVCVHNAWKCRDETCDVSGARGGGRGLVLVVSFFFL